jgi:hypothetical protein
MVLTTSPAGGDFEVELSVCGSAFTAGYSKPLGGLLSDSPVSKFVDVPPKVVSLPDVERSSNEDQGLKEQNMLVYRSYSSMTFVFFSPVSGNRKLNHFLSASTIDFRF